MVIPGRCLLSTSRGIPRPTQVKLAQHTEDNMHFIVVLV